MTFPIFIGYPEYIRKPHLLLSIILLLFLAAPPNMASADETFYSIRLDTVDEVQLAEKKVEDLKKLGHNAFYRGETTEGKGEVFGVFIERYKTEEEAEKEAGVMKDLGLITDYKIEAIEIKKKTVPQVSESRELKEKGYYLQVGSMKDRINAENLVAKLQQSGYRALYREETVKGKGIWYRVYINGYKSKLEAEKDANVLLKSGIISGYALRSMGGETWAASHSEKREKVFFLHVSSFREKSNAEQEVISLKDQGYKAFMVDEKISGEVWFRVYIGDFKNEISARKAGAELLRKGIISYFKPIEIDMNRLGANKSK
jgi:cell division protein FtsN